VSKARTEFIPVSKIDEPYLTSSLFFLGVRHEGTPSGEFKKINGVDCYVATPEGDYAKDKVLLFLPDAFGMQLVNNQVRGRL